VTASSVALRVAELHLARANFLRQQAADARTMGQDNLAACYERMADVRMGLAKDAMS
jgi:hypothetical protein